MEKIKTDSKYTNDNVASLSQEKLLRVQTLALVLPETLMHSHRLLWATIDFEHAQFSHESQ